MISVCIVNRLVFRIEVVFFVRYELNIYIVGVGVPRLTQQHIWSWRTSTPRRTDRPPVVTWLTWYPNVALGQVCLRVLRCLPVIIPPVPRTDSLIFETSFKRADGRTLGPISLNMMLVQKSRGIKTEKHLCCFRSSAVNENEGYELGRKMTSVVLGMNSV